MFRLKYDMFQQIETPIIILSTVWHKHLGTISNIPVKSINATFNENKAQEISFDVYKEIDGKVCDLWDSIVDFKYIFVPQYQEYYEIRVSLEEKNSTVKHVVGTSSCEIELGNKMLRNFEVNTESDIMRGDYEVTTIYDSQNTNASLIDRALSDKASNYTVAHVDDTVAKLQRRFSVDNKGIYDFFNDDVAKECSCLFKYDSVNRTISVYDLLQNCNNCNYRGDYINICPKCGSKDIKMGYGIPTNIFISTENFANSITVNTNADEVKNCFKIEGGDELMTATIANINPNGSNYIYKISDLIKADMPEQLVEKLDSYDELYQENFSTYEDLTEQLYNLVDEELYLTSSMMPDIEIPITDVESELAKLESELNKVAVTNINSISNASVDIAVKGMAKVIIDPRFEVEIVSSSVSDVINNQRTWSGIFKVISKADDEVYAESTENTTITITGDDYETYLYQKIQKALGNEDKYFSTIFEIEDINKFKEELTKYSLNRLKSFESSYQSCLEIMIENGVTTTTQNLYGVDLYTTMYKPYYEKLVAIQQEMVVREGQITEIQVNNETVSKIRYDIQELLNFRNYLGDDLWFIFCTYLKEDTYSNDNYISEGLTNTKVLDRAQELFDVANIEISKASELQYTLSNTVGNLFSTKEFSSFRDYITLGSWLICMADEEKYKLRLINIGINYGDLTSTTLVFSNVVKAKDYMSDVTDLFQQTRSIVNSYDYITHQAQQGEDANNILKDYRTIGLNSALYNITNSATKDVLIDEHGISCKLYDDITESHYPEELRIINNTIAFTKDSWKTVSTALGKLMYELDGVLYESYGLNADHVISGLMISGDIYSGNYSSADKTGTHINLNDGTFTFAGDKLTYDGDELSLNGKITATSGNIAGFEIGETAIFNGTNSLTSTDIGIYLGTDGIRQYKDANQYIHIQNGILKCNGGQFTGAITGSSFTVNGSVTKYANNYDENDIVIMREIITGIRDITLDYLEKYDLNGDGRISTMDVVLARRFVDGIDTSQTYNTSLTITPTSTLNILTTEGVSIGRLGLYAQNITTNTFYAKQIYTLADSTNGYIPGASGSFNVGEYNIRVNNGIITQIMATS